MARLGAPLGFWSGIVLAAAGGRAWSAWSWRCVLLRRIYRAPELFQLLATFGVVLVVQDAALAIWGREDLFAPRAPGLKGTVEILGERFPQYHLFLIVPGSDRARRCCGCCSIARAGVCWCAPRRRIGRWPARSA